jgi:hypothetical protein
MELDAGPQLEDEAQAVALVAPFGGELGLDREVGPQRQQVVVDEVDDLALGQVVRADRVERLHVLIAADQQRAAADRRLRIARVGTRGQKQPKQ